MHRPVLFASILVLAAPLAAQDMQQPPSASPPSQAQPPAAQPSTGAVPQGNPFGAHDADQNGSLNRAEFTAMVRAQSPSAPPSEADVTAAFQRADADGNGEISAAEAAAQRR